MPQAHECPLEVGMAQLCTPEALPNTQHSSAPCLLHVATCHCSAPHAGGSGPAASQVHVSWLHLLLNFLSEEI